MGSSSHADILRWTLLGALGASLTLACGGTAETGPQGGDGDAPGGDGDSGGGDGDVGGGAIAECSNPTDLGGGFVACDEGYTHRTQAGQCPSSLPRDEEIGDPTVCTTDDGCCITDLDCAGPNEYCRYSSGEAIGAWCTIGCRTDADCGEGAICQCGDPIGTCVNAECQSDADCSGEARCASFVTNDGCGPYTRYSCQTAADECDSNDDCAADEECDGSGGVRQCVTQEFLCAIGRPFLVDDEIRVAPLCERGDWTVELLPLLQTESSADREALAVAWESAAQMEHASIAAFARFAMQLLALGAPADLVERTHQAMADETRHARVCLGLASHYRERQIGPCPLDMAGVMSGVSLRHVVAATILEGCCGETAAALEAAEAAAHCEDQTVRLVLEQIAKDESRHAELAWQFVHWVLARHPELKPFVASQFQQACAEVNRGSETSTDPGPLARHGVLDEGARTSVRLSALQQVVQPCAEKLLGTKKEPKRLASPTAAQERA